MEREQDGGGGRGGEEEVAIVLGGGVKDGGINANKGRGGGEEGFFGLPEEAPQCNG